MSTHPADIHKNMTCRRILRALTPEPTITIDQISELVGVTVHTLTSRHLSALKHAGLIRVGDWKTGIHGCKALYVLGSGPDKPKPNPSRPELRAANALRYTENERMARQRLKERAQAQAKEQQEHSTITEQIKPVVGMWAGLL